MALERIMPQADLPRQPDSRDDIFVRSEAEARDRGIEVRVPQPPEEHCKFCGKPLVYTGVAFAGMLIAWSPMPERCTCEKAVAYWKRADDAEARKKEAAEVREEQGRQQRRIDRLIGNSGIKKRFLQRTFAAFRCDTPERKVAYDVAKAYADEWDAHKADGTGLYIEGTNGTGKTHLAAAIAIQLITERHVPCICKTAGDLLLDIKNTFDNGEGITEKQVLDLYKEVDLLIIDDLGKERCTDWSVSTLYSILNDRYEEMRPTIITTNYNSDDLVKALTVENFDSEKIKSIISRLHEVSQVLTMAWKDARSGD